MRPHLNWIPESHMSKGEITGVHNTSESPAKKLEPGTDGRIEPNLVLLVLEKSFQGDHNHFDHILHCVARWIQVPGGLRLRKERVDFGWSLRHVLSFSLLLHLGM